MALVSWLSGKLRQQRALSFLFILSSFLSKELRQQRFQSCLLFLISCLSLNAQIEVTNGPPFDPTTLIENIFLGGGVEIIDVQYDGDPRSLAFFQNAEEFIGIDRGIVMTTGLTEDLTFGVDANGSVQSGIDTDSPITSDPDLQSIVGNFELNDIARYIITFRPIGDSLEFSYAFGSEEYPEYVCSQFNDVFGFFISGPGINGPFQNNAENIAIIPGTNLPVQINYLNGGSVGNNGTLTNCQPPNGSLSFSQFYRDNDGSDQGPIYDGFTVGLTARAEVVPCEEYTIKLIIADVGDPNFDSGVFLEAKSFGGNTIDADLVDISVDGSLAEGCRAATINFFTPNPVAQDTELEVSFFGDATPGVDYTMPPPIIIPAGDTSVSITIEAFEDNLVEDPDENIFISLRKNPCRVDTLQIRIRPNILVESLLQDTAFLACPGDSEDLDATIPVELPDPPRFFNDNPLTIGDPDIFGSPVNTVADYSSFITISNIQPEMLGPGIIKSVCIDSLQHQWIDDLDIFLIGPNGQVVELTTDNGADGGNLLANDFISSMCFVPVGGDSLTNFPGGVAPPSLLPFTGEWEVEGTWSDVYNGEYETNGQWELRIFDDTQGGGGRLYEWSICLERQYEIEYSWAQNPDGLSCVDCPDPTYSGENDGYIYMRAEDTYGCVEEDSVFILFQDIPDLGEPFCIFADDSTITIGWTDPPGGVVSYEVRLDRDDPWIDVGTANEFTFTGLDLNTSYEMEVRAIFTNCVGPPRSVTCQTTGCVLLSTTASVEDATCAGSNDATVTLTPNAGEAPFTFTLGADDNGSGIFENLLAAEYDFRIEDDRGCVDSLTVEVGEPAALTSGIELVQGIDCAGDDDGILAALPGGGTGAYSYTWNATTGDSLNQNLPPGEYILELIDENNCSILDTFTLTAPTELLATSSTTPQNCAGLEDGTATISVSGGTPGYNYAWSEASVGNTPDAMNLPSGTYFVTATDGNGCELLDTLVVDLEPNVDFSLSGENIRCFGENNGSIEVNVNVGQDPLIYDWAGPTPATGPQPGGLTAGTYTLNLTDDRGCESEQMITIMEPSELVGSGQATDVSCGGGSDGTIEFTTQGGTLPYTFAWSDSGATDEDRMNLTGGSYDLTVTDDNGCQIERSFTVGELPAIVVDFLIDSVDCAGETTGGIFAQLQNGQPPFDFSWSGGLTGNRLEDLPAGTYDLVVTDANDCVLNARAVVPEPPPLAAELTVEDIRCNGLTDGLIEIDVSGGSMGYQFQINGGPWQASNAFLGLDAGTYTVSARDQNGCAANFDGLIVSEPDPLSVDLGENITIQFGDSTFLTPSVDGGTQTFLSYAWSPRDSSLLSCFDCSAVWARPDAQSTVFLRVTDASGCTADDLIIIFVEKNFPVAVPTGFTPNGDNNNDLLLVHGRPGIEVLYFEIFDRWGESVYIRENFMVNDNAEGWDGNFRDDPMNGGVFVWQLKARDPSGEEFNLSGQTTLIR
ncbi:MAG: choice-of-anchor L domain-containing protein [Bacteroidota bacterium]